MNSWDIDILLWINGHHAAWLDGVMWYVSQPWFWIPLYLYMAYRLIRAGRWGELLALVLVVVLTDQICNWMKEYVCRPRPTHCADLEGMLHLVRGYVGGTYGFPSAHAANTLAVAGLYGVLNYNSQCPMVNSQWSIVNSILLLYVLVNSYSRVYLGVHYPSDILVGLLLGAATAALLGTSFKLVHKWYMVHD